MNELSTFVNCATGLSMIWQSTRGSRNACSTSGVWRTARSLNCLWFGRDVKLRIARDYASQFVSRTGWACKVFRSFLRHLWADVAGTLQTFYRWCILCLSSWWNAITIHWFLIWKSRTLKLARYFLWHLSTLERFSIGSEGCIRWRSCDRSVSRLISISRSCFTIDVGQTSLWISRRTPCGFGWPIWYVAWKRVFGSPGGSAWWTA